MAKREVAEGHILANHSFSHDYKAIYASPQALLDEIKKTEETIIKTVGEEGTRACSVSRAALSKNGRSLRTR